MRRLILLGLLTTGAVFAQCTSPCLVEIVGNGMTTFTTTPIDTTGAKFIAFSLGYYTVNPPVLSDSAGNSTPTCLTAETVTASSFGNVLCYLINPTTSTSHTFTVTGTGTIFSSLIVGAFSTANLSYTGLRDGTSIAGPTTTYSYPTGVTPHATGDIILASASAGLTGTSTLSINTSFKIVNQISYVGGTSFGSALAFLVAPSGSLVNPTWTDTQSEAAAISIASFTVGGTSQVISNGFAPFAPF